MAAPQAPARCKLRRARHRCAHTVLYHMPDAALFPLAAATHLGRIGGRRRGPNGIVWRRRAAAHGGRSAAAPARAHAWLVAVRTGYRKLLVFIRRAPGKTERGKQAKLVGYAVQPPPPAPLAA